MRVFVPVSALALAALALIASPGPLGVAWGVADPLGVSGMAPLEAALVTDSVFVTLIDSPDPVAVGERLTYDISVLFAGIVMGAHVELTNALPEGVLYVSSQTTMGFCEHSEGAVGCILDIAPAGEHVTVTIVVTPIEAGTLRTTAFVTAADPKLHSNTATETTEVVARRRVPAAAIPASTETTGQAPAPVGGAGTGNMALEAAEGLRKLMGEQDARIESLEWRLATAVETRSRPRDAAQSRDLLMARLSWLLLGAIGGAGILAMLIPKRRS